MSLSEVFSHSPSNATTQVADTFIQRANRDVFSTRIALRYAGEQGVLIAFEWQGNPNAPVIIVAGGISATRHVSLSTEYPERGWWEAQVGPGRSIDTNRFRVLAINWLGSEGNLDVAIDSADQADAIAATLDYLNIKRAFAFVGASYGAMVGLQFSARHGARIEKLIAISGADSAHPFSSAWRALQRNIVRLNRNGENETAALSLARQLAMLSYRTPEEFAERFATPVRLENDIARSPAENYLEVCGNKYAAITNTTAFLRLSESIDLHQVNPEQIKTSTTLVAIEEDRLVPVETLVTLEKKIGTRCQLKRIHSVFGHDAFLVESEQIADLLSEALHHSDLLGAAA
ncbi:MAG TPA: homoserine O-succinyltransferase [Arenimonas sp.]|nr:homoserine O-succinyltransferase [Arenimonas sp.]